MGVVATAVVATAVVVTAVVVKIDTETVIRAARRRVLAFRTPAALAPIAARATAGGYRETTWSRNSNCEFRSRRGLGECATPN